MTDPLTERAISFGIILLILAVLTALLSMISLNVAMCFIGCAATIALLAIALY